MPNNDDDETCERCKFSFGPLFLACGNKRSEFFEGPVLPVGWCPEFEREHRTTELARSAGHD